LIPISRSSEYAIRAMTFMAQQNEPRFVLVRDMARRLGIPAPFLGKVLQPLVARGMLISQRGRNGGFRLALPPGEITLFQVVDSQEHLGRARQCFLGQAECTDERACPMHDFWKKASNDFLTRLASMTLSDLLRFCDSAPQSGYPAPLPQEPASSRRKSVPTKR
jgi:Rrf2 family protein